MQNLGELLRLLADETRLQLLMTLLEDEMTVSELAVRLNLPQPRISSHLALLRDANLVTVETVGRQRTYRVDAALVGPVLATLQSLLPTSQSAGPGMPSREQVTASTQARREIQRNSAIRQARTCYDHLAGVAGVQVLDELLKRHWLVAQPGEQPRYQLTEQGAEALRARGVDLVRSRNTRRLFASGCLDWTERRFHLGGALGAAILQALEDAAIVRRDEKRRGIILLAPLSHWLDGQGSPISS